MRRIHLGEVEEAETPIPNPTVSRLQTEGVGIGSEGTAGEEAIGSGSGTGGEAIEEAEEVHSSSSGTDAMVEEEEEPYLACDMASSSGADPADASDTAGEVEESETDAEMVAYVTAYDPQIFPDIFVWVRCPPDGLHVRVVLERNMTVAEIIQNARAFVAATYEHQSAILEGIYHLTNRAGYDLEPQWTMIDYDFINGEILRLGYMEPDPARIYRTFVPT